MTATDRYLLASTHARDAAYDVILLAHVLAAVVGLAALVIAGANAWILRRSGPDIEAIRRYYRPGVNWAGRVLFLVPILGFSLMAMSHGDWSFSDAWITIGLALWAFVAVAAEMYLWPAERRLQGVVSSMTALAPIEDTGSEAGAGTVGGAGPGTGLRSEALRVAVLAATLSLVLIVAAVVMAAKP